MYSSVFARSAVRSRAVTRPMRSGYYHWENEDGSHLPFSTKNKPALAIGMTAFLAWGFSIPFLGAWWQLHKVGKPVYRPGPPPE
ncbi:16899_t:CDS:2 [Dentiscutata erythropus]|uniref:Cytochrome c oxidase subunit 8, mitochondrial n=1 Tax=Dentiscutata erythropus TaxID=1348616 RepID=A0A9N9E9W0_9GLOM|nr:16899_t:CDS:2 [Dentiscutata erythropus]